jgi:hypothetical protein
MSVSFRIFSVLSVVNFLFSFFVKEDNSAFVFETSFKDGNK